MAGPPGTGDSDDEMSNCSLVLSRWAVEHNSANQALVSPGHAGSGVECLLARVYSWENYLEAVGSEPWMDSSLRSPRGSCPTTERGSAGNTCRGLYRRRRLMSTTSTLLASSTRYRVLPIP